MEDVNNKVEVQEKKIIEQVEVVEGENVEEGIIDMDMSQKNNKKRFMIPAIAVGVVVAATIAIVIALQGKGNDNGNIGRKGNVSESGNAKTEARLSESMPPDIVSTTSPTALVDINNASQAPAVSKPNASDSSSKDNSSKNGSNTANSSTSSAKTSETENEKRTTVKIDMKEFNKTYIQGIEVYNKEWLVDIDGDGKDDKLYMTADYESEVETGIIKVYVNDKVAATFKNSTNDGRELFYLADMNKDDNKLELLIRNDCYDPPFYYHVYYYENGKFIEGPSFRRTSPALFPLSNIKNTAGMLMQEYDVFINANISSFIIPSSYNSNTHKIDVINDNGVIDIEDWKVTLNENVTIYSDADFGSSKTTLTKQRITVSKIYLKDISKDIVDERIANDFWIYVTADDNTCGWVCIEYNDYCYTIDGMEVVDLTI